MRQAAEPCAARCSRTFDVVCCKLAPMKDLVSKSVRSFDEEANKAAQWKVTSDEARV